MKGPATGPRKKRSCLIGLNMLVNVRQKVPYKLWSISYHVIFVFSLRSQWCVFGRFTSVFYWSKENSTNWIWNNTKSSFFQRRHVTKGIYMWVQHYLSRGVGTTLLSSKWVSVYSALSAMDKLKCKYTLTTNDHHIKVHIIMLLISHHSW